MTASAYSSSWSAYTPQKAHVDSPDYFGFDAPPLKPLPAPISYVQVTPGNYQAFNNLDWLQSFDFPAFTPNTPGTTTREFAASDDPNAIPYVYVTPQNNSAFDDLAPVTVTPGNYSALPPIDYVPVTPGNYSAFQSIPDYVPVTPGNYSAFQDMPYVQVTPPNYSAFQAPYQPYSPSAYAPPSPGYYNYYSYTPPTWYYAPSYQPSFVGFYVWGTQGGRYYGG